MAEYITDLHFHSKYSRAVSKSMDLETTAQWAARKGIDVITAADFTHPAWFTEISEKLIQQDNGLFQLQGDTSGTHFMLTTEISCIYKKNDKGRRIHNVIFAPDIAAVESIIKKLDAVGNLKSDGRPIIGLDSRELLKIVLDASPDAMLIPAHIWTPWFSMFGSKSGFDTVEECFEEMSKYIYAVETGLSSDPQMNWRLSQLDRMAIVSFSDAHSPAKMGREATVFELETLSYTNIVDAIKHKSEKNKIAYTVEFYPEEGRYHWDGHRACDIRLSPPETIKQKSICPKCKKPLTVGVLNRVEELADRPESYQAKNRPPFKSLVPLQEIIAECVGVGVGSKRVKAEYDALIEQGINEFNILLNLKHADLKKITSPIIADGIQKVRGGKINITPGYDGEYGIVKVFTDEERKKFKSDQPRLL